jgi:hypothetical protein
VHLLRPEPDPSAAPSPGRTRGRAARTTLGAVVGVCVLMALVGPASGAPDAVAEARAALSAATTDREQAEGRVRDAQDRLATAQAESTRLGEVDAELSAELTEARRALREYAIAAYIDGGQSEVFRATLSLEQAQALAWQSSLLLGQSVSADETAARYESLKEANEPQALAAATEVDRADAELQEARFDLIQSAAFERDAEAALARATAAAEAAEREAAARRAAASAAAAAAAAPAGAAGPSGAGAAGSSGPGRGDPSAAESATLARIRRCESRGNYSIVSASGRYRGAYQFDVTTWRGVGGSGDPAAASAAEQDYRALLLLRMRGTRPWPNCGR